MSKSFWNILYRQYSALYIENNINVQLVAQKSNKLLNAKLKLYTNKAKLALINNKLATNKF